MKPLNSEMTLNEILEALDYTTGPSKFQSKKQISKNGEVVFEGTAHEVTAWLRQANQINF
jgi:hypothetical protein